MYFQSLIVIFKSHSFHNGRNDVFIRQLQLWDQIIRLTNKTGWIVKSCQKINCEIEWSYLGTIHLFFESAILQNLRKDFIRTKMHTTVFCTMYIFSIYKAIMVGNIWFLSPLVLSKWEVPQLSQFVYFWGECVYFSIFEW
jgi:hypothetical protein